MDKCKKVEIFNKITKKYFGPITQKKNFMNMNIFSLKSNDSLKIIQFIVDLENNLNIKLSNKFIFSKLTLKVKDLKKKSLNEKK